MKLGNPIPQVDRVPVPRIGSEYVPEYQGASWLDAALPKSHLPWPADTQRLVFVPSVDDEHEASIEQVQQYCAGKFWVWPSQTIYFFCDQHADADAFLSSLIASGGVAKTGPNDEDLELTEAGRNAKFVIGGDCFDKGPSNLRLLDVLRLLIDRGGDVEILAGNHDLRLLVGLRYAHCKDNPKFAHLFARMGKKAVPLFREVYERYLSADASALHRVSEDEARALLFPDASWYETFPQIAGDLLPHKKIAKEVRRIREKTLEMEAAAARAGLNLSMVYAAAEKCRELFLSEDGDYHWFFDQMNLAMRAGSFLLVHAGVDDVLASAIRREGVASVNAWFRQLMSDDPFDLYHGPVGNVFRTKYRTTDWPLTPQGTADMCHSGLYAVMHGHRNILRGQRIALRKGLLNFECDASVDRNTRIAEGLDGGGGAVTIIRPDGKVVAISTDYPCAKLFDPTIHAATTTIV